MTRPSTRDLRARSVLAGEASAASAELEAALETSPVSRTAGFWLVTTAPVKVARQLARRLGLTGALGTVAAERDGFYTGELVGDLLHGPAKAEAVLSDWTEGGTPRVVDSGCFSSKPRCCLGRNGDS